jgi:hypothetical protein
MKTIARTLIILVAALVVVGVTMAVTNSSSSAQDLPNFQEGQLPQRGTGDFVPGEWPEDGSGGEHGSGSLLGWSRHLLVISAIVFVVVIIERFWRKLFKPYPARVIVK